MNKKNKKKKYTITVVLLVRLDQWNRANLQFIMARVCCSQEKIFLCLYIPLVTDL